MNAPQGQSDEVTLAVLSTKIDALTESMHKIESRMSDTTATHVTRQEWTLRNDFVDERAYRMHSEMKQLNEEIESRRAPWWAVTAVIASFAALGWQVIEPMFTR